MTPLENELLQQLGLAYMREVEELSISGFFYGASSSLRLAVLVVRLIQSSITGLFVLLFSASVVIFVFVFSFCGPLISQQDLIPET